MAVGVSGGIDSMCLLYWLHQIGADVVCLHVNHKLRAEADVETDYVANVCKQLNIPCQIFYWDDKKPEKGLEAAARDARYKMMIDFCHENGIEYYKDDKRMEGFRRMLKSMSKDFDIIDSKNLLDLINTGKIDISHTEDISKTIYVPVTQNRSTVQRKGVK